MSSIIVIETKKSGINTPGGKQLLNEIELIMKENDLVLLSDKKNEKLLVYFSKEKKEINEFIEQLKLNKIYNSAILKIYFHEILKQR